MFFNVVLNWRNFDKSGHTDRMTSHLFTLTLLASLDKKYVKCFKRKSFFTEVDIRKIFFYFFLFAEILFCIFNLFSRSLITAKLCSFYFNLHNSVPNIQTNQKRMDGVPGIRTQDHKMEVTVLWALVTDCKPRFRYS